MGVCSVECRRRRNWRERKRKVNKPVMNIKMRRKDKRDKKRVGEYLIQRGNHIQK